MKKFLIVDDDPTSRELLGFFLSPYGQCDFAVNGHESLEAFRQADESGTPYDLICMDIMMPGTDGHNALDVIREIERQRGLGGSAGVKVIMTTAMRDSKHCVRAFRQGCEAYLTKPIGERQLLAQVEQLLGRLPPPQKSARARTYVDHSADTPPAPRAPAEKRTPPAAEGRRPRYLIVDDDAVCRELLKDILSIYADCDFAYDGAEAIDAVRLALEDGEFYDLICLDIMMPGTSGHEALQTIREMETERGICGSDGVKVIMTTALRDSKHCLRAFREGCESYVTKPIRQEQLLNSMRDLGLLAGVAQD